MTPGDRWPRRRFFRRYARVILSLMNVPLTHAAEGLERRAFSVADVIRMVEIGVLGRDERFELIGGEIVPMSPKDRRHELVKSGLCEMLFDGRPTDIRIMVETTLYLSRDGFVEPDIVLVPRAAVFERLAPTDVRLVVEISHSTLAFDLGRKATIYAAHHVPEMWVIDAAGLVTHVHRDPRGDRFADIRVVPPNEALMPFGPSGRPIRLADLS
ncbi:MAG: hypothetical protein BroJett030_22160 [Alphaproteobacteria bacterium]|nr:MAG: hypothetical protein BroJett030_22160 [Alphaproteobacteria bacterium]